LGSNLALRDESGELEVNGMTGDGELGLPKSGATDGAACAQDQLFQISAAPDVANRRVPAVLQAKIIGP